MPKSSYLRKSLKKFISSAREYFEREKVVGRVDDIDAPVKRTAECLRVSESTVKRVSRETRGSGGQFQSPKKQGKGRPKILLEEFLKGVIRRKMHEYYLEKEFPTIEKLHKYLKQHVPEFPRISKSSLLKQIKQMGFRFKKFGNKPVLMESTSIRGARAEYLIKINRLRKAGYKIFYTDETWCGANHSKRYGWQQQLLPDEQRQNFDYLRNVQQCNGWRGGLCKPSGAGKRAIILHIGSKDGFFPLGKKCFVGKKDTTDYHNEMNAKHYEEWFREVLSALPEKSGIVIDQAPYHTMINPEKKNPTSKWLKNDIILWLVKKNVPLPEGVSQWTDLTKPYLLLTAKPHYNEKETLLHSIVKESGKNVELIWLPVAHCELNAIELVWAYIKNEVAKRNKTFKVEDVCQLSSEIMNNIPCDLWENCIKHVMKIEQKYLESDAIVDVQIDTVIVNLNESSDSSEESDSDDHDSESEG